MSYTFQIAWIILLILLLLGFALKIMEERKKRWEQADGLQYEKAEWFKEYAEEWKKVFVTVRWESYVYWNLEPFQGKHINVNEHGLRITYNPQKTEAKRSPINIFMFGGSTMWGAGARDRHTIASILSRFLCDAGVDARISNFAQLGYVSSQEVISLISELKNENPPKITIFYDGFNDVFSALTNGVAGIPLKESNRRAEFNITKSGGKLLKAFIKNFKIFQLLNYRANPKHIGAKIRGDENELSDDVVRIFKSNIKLVETLGATYGFSPIFYWQPTIFHKNHLTEYEQKQARKIEHSKLFFQTAYHKIKSCDVLSNKVNFHYIADLFSDIRHPYYIDFGHITEGGNQEIANRMLVDVLEIIENLKK